MIRSNKRKRSTTCISSDDSEQEEDSVSADDDSDDMIPTYKRVALNDCKVVDSSYWQWIGRKFIDLDCSGANQDGSITNSSWVVTGIDKGSDNIYYFAYCPEGSVNSSAATEHTPCEEILHADWVSWKN